jgi:hypothetical protein
MARAKVSINLIKPQKNQHKFRDAAVVFYYVCIYCFAAAGLFFIGGYLLSQWHLTDVSGIVDSQNPFFQSYNAASTQPSAGASSSVGSLAGIQQSIDQLSQLKLYKMKIFCQIQGISQIAGGNAQNMVEAYHEGASDDTVLKMIQAVELRMGYNQELNSLMQGCSNLTVSDVVPDYSAQPIIASSTMNVFPWTEDDTWPILSAAIIKDQGEIMQVSQITGVDPRLIVSAMFAEQSRLFRTERGLFKQYLAPLKILASENQFSLGVMGIKPATAIEVEQNLTNSYSPMYLGVQYVNLLDFSTSDESQERYDRLSDVKNHYYSYLYGALYIKQLETQWQNAGYPISGRPEIIGTLYNIGFAHSKPNGDPKVGGAIIAIDNVNYTFGSLVYEFYYSGELLSQFPFGYSQF